MRRIALLNQKGGTGKTTCTVNIGVGLSRLGKTILLIDMDPQASLTYSLGTKAHELPRAIYELIKGEASIEDILIERDGIFLIPANLNLSGADLELAGTPGREFLLKEALSNVSLVSPDYILIDCPPALSLLSLMALTAAKEVYIPLQTEYLALQGLTKLVQTIGTVRKRLNPDLAITGIIPTRFDARKILNREVLSKIQEYFSEKVFDTLIRENISIAEAPSHGKSIFEYKSTSHGAEDYANLCQEILRREESYGEKDQTAKVGN